MDYINELVKNREQFFNFMKEKYPLHQNSNIFLRDIQYAVKYYFERKNIALTYNKIYKLTDEFIILLEKENLVIRLNKNSWKVNFQPGSIV